MSTAHDDLDAWKRQRTVALALELADSGRYENFADIAYALQFEHGIATAQALIDHPEMRRQLNERCADAREALLPQVPEEPQAPELPESLPAQPATPSFLGRAAAVLRRAGASTAKPVGTGDLNSAAS
ncbi:hypothetical protein P9239_21585 [Caballeronia sp. LZ062]|uniref:hypothetical protein n=1 Tax=unclassified Caballeronia TaxID=2646786 RepID=UPI002854C665|nr:MULTISPECIES: hypothetical protein [unclassified Caballeronia]MDR5856272.1 hypothetical protein [Caballeronia sp. LZ050]MDR5872943.1 hypothetical protein [Caballeronia sp. LZ062]